MKDSIKNRKKGILALCLSAMMFSSVAAFAACSSSTTDSTDSSSSSSSTEQVKDDSLITNPHFATFDEDNAINTTVTGWTRSTTSIVGSSALSSKAASGIIDLDTEAWENLTGSKVNVNELTETTAAEKWDEMTVKDKLAYYDLWKEQNTDKTISSELDFYETMNIDSGDIPTVAAFDTHEGAVAYNAIEENVAKRDTKVLMIHNEYPEASSTATYKALGTGQQYTSSSTVTIAAGTSAQFSLWVKTADLKCSATDGSVQDAVGKGAFISITHSVGGKTMDAYTIENINTANVTENNGWQQFTFLIKGSSYTDTTFTLVLGLGQGSATYRGEYVNGYAFFDDIYCSQLDNGTFNLLVQERQIDTTQVIRFDDEGEDKVVDVSKTPRTHFAMDFYGDFEDLNVLSTLTTDLTQTSNYTSASGNTLAPWLGNGKDASKDVAQVFATAQDILDGVGVADEKKTALATLYTKYLADDTAFANEETLLLMSVDGAAYTAKTPVDLIKFSDYTLNGTERADYLVVSFFVKTSNMAGYTGGGVTVVDGKNKTSFSSIDTSEMEAVKIADDKLHGDWQQYFFFIENAAEDAEKDATAFGLEFTFGPTSVEVDTAIDSYYAGFAAFTNFEILPLSKAEYESAQSGTYTKVLSVGATTETSSEGEAFDSAKGTPSTALEDGLADPKNYKGVAFDSAYLVAGGSTAFNTNENAGLIAKEHFTAADGYYSTASYAWLNAVKAASGKTTAEEVWADIFGNSTQPLFIYTAADETQNAAYGYIGNSTQISASAYAAISVRVRGTGKAYIRLVDTNADNYQNLQAYNKTLSVGGYLTYWYNDDGNICTGDPDEKATQVAFKLQSNGLYKANKSGWDGYANLAEKDAWYANLSAYVDKDAEGNLLVASGGAKHDYNDYWNNAGMNGIAFYYDKTNDRYCADAELKIPVIDLASVAGLTPRYQAVSASDYQLEAEVTASADDWTTVTFYVHTGDVAKDYRLEIWSGSKDGKGNAAGSYLVFDYNNPGTAESNFSGLLEEYEDKATVQFESVFSYFDTASYLRYNADLDENDIGNLYEDNFTPSANEAGTAYLKYEEGGYITIIADYQYTEKTVAASAVEEDEEEEDSSSDDETDTNVWLLASSLAVAGVLILAIGSIVIRKVVVKTRKTHAANGGKKKK